jgi:hypothetical protein
MYMLGGGHEDDANVVYEFSFGSKTPYASAFKTRLVNLY